MEIKQTNFRVNQETADAFRKFCDENGLSQAQGFDHVMAVVEMDRAKAAIPGRLTEIETFEKGVKDLLSAYMNSLEICQNAEGRIREAFVNDLTRKDRTIDELRETVDRLQAEKDAAEKSAAAAAEKLATTEKVAAAAKESSAANELLVSTLKEKFADMEKKVKDYDAMSERLQEMTDELLRISKQKKG